MKEQMDSKTLASIQKLQAGNQEDLLQRDNVVGAGVGTKWTDGKDTGEPCLSVFVSQKLETDQLSDDQLIPDTIDAFPTDVYETGDIFAGAEMVNAPLRSMEPKSVAELEEFEDEVTVELLRNRIRPVVGGFSVAHPRVTAGTYATAVIDSAPGIGIPRRYYVLSNNHVIANSNNARIGDPILQPGPYDGGIVGRDTIAHLSRFIPIHFYRNRDEIRPNYVDAAIAEGDFDTLNREIYWIGNVRGVKPPQIGMKVRKTGRTTNYSTGRIFAINATLDVNYGGSRIARFDRQVLTTDMSAGGDSGSLLLDEDNNAVGLIFAGSPTVTVCNDIRYVQRMLGIRFF